MDERKRAPATNVPRADGDLLAPGLVHELRQPLTGLDAGLQLAARDLGSSLTSLDGWRIARTQLARIQETLETYHQLMNPGRAEHGPFSVEPVVRRAVDALRFRLDALGDRFAVVIEREVPRAHGSAHALLHALTNLLGNALDAVQEANEAGRVEVRVVRAPGEEGRAQVRVADGGAGIPPERRARLFTPRFTTKPRGKGSGLGLAIARRMMRTAGGEVRLALDDEPDRRPWARTEFVIDLAAGPTSPAPRDGPPAREERAPGAARMAAVVAALAVAAALGWIGFHRWIRAGDAAASMPPAHPDEVAVVEVQGAIQRLEGGAWRPVARGERLHEEDTLRTAPGARATIAIGERSRLTVSDATQLTVREMTAAVQRLRLSRGHLSVVHQPDGARVLVIESERGESVARAGSARFSVLANGTSLAVATETGVVRLQAADRSVDVSAGEQSAAGWGEAPSPPTRISAGLLLRAAKAARARDGACTVEGKVDPGVEVRVEGRPLTPDRDGRFVARIPARRGTTHATVTMRDAAGRVMERRLACVTDPVEQDVSDFAVRWGHR